MVKGRAMSTPTSGRSYSLVGTSGDYRIDALVGDTKWGGPAGGGATVTYSFPGQPAWWSTSTSLGYGPPDGGGFPWADDVFPLGAAQQAAFRQALTAWGEVANVRLTEVADNQFEAGDIRAASSGVLDDINPAWTAAAYLPGPGPAAGDVWFNPWHPANADVTAGGSGYYIMLHEIGHALGLGHPFEGATLPFAEENQQYTVMSYTPAPATWETGEYASTPMLYDIAAIQYVYGPNYSTRAGNDTYPFSPRHVEVRTIWDGGGEDTFDASGHLVGVSINLAPGSFSAIGTSGVGNIGIAYGVTIENAIGGGGPDEFQGNSANNRISGGAGDDVLWGNGGNDSLVGDQGDDIILGNTGNDTIFGGDEADIQWGGQGDDVLLGNRGPDILLANRGNDVVFGGQDADAVDGGQGNDTLIGNAGDDTLLGGAGNDVFVFENDSGQDRILDYQGAGDALGDEILISSAIMGSDEEALAAVGEDVDGNAVINLGDGNDVTLVGVDSHLLTGADFFFS